MKVYLAIRAENHDGGDYETVLGIFSSQNAAQEWCQVDAHVYELGALNWQEINSIVIRAEVADETRYDVSWWELDQGIHLFR